MEIFVSISVYTFRLLWLILKLTPYVHFGLPVVDGSPKPGGHVNGVGRRQLELDRVDLEAECDGVEEGLLRLLPELEDGRKDVVPLQLLGRLGWHARRCPLLGRGGAPRRPRRAKVDVVTLVTQW